MENMHKPGEQAEQTGEEILQGLISCGVSLDKVQWVLRCVCLPDTQSQPNTVYALHSHLKQLAEDGMLETCLTSGIQWTS